MNQALFKVAENKSGSVIHGRMEGCGGLSRRAAASLGTEEAPHPGQESTEKQEGPASRWPSVPSPHRSPA